MIPLEIEINRLKSLYHEMHDLVREQVNLTRNALITTDAEAACEVMRQEGRVNFYENTIAKDCEDFLALHRPVASDLRLVISIIKMSGNLERIGDHAYRISSYLCDQDMRFNEKLIKQLKLNQLFNEIEFMLAIAKDAFDKKDVKLAKQVFKHDKLLNKTNKNMPRLMEKYASKQKGLSISHMILLSRTIGKLERMGDLIKNIAEEIIFYAESTVIKHRKKNKKIKKRFNVIE